MTQKTLMILIGIVWLWLPSLQAQDDCGVLPSQLIVGQDGRVTPGDANNMRDMPSTDGNRVGQIPGEAQFTVLDGPVCSGGYTWWQIDYGGLIGWTVESIGDSYTLEPLIPPTPTPIPTATPLPTTRQTADHVIWSADGSTLAVSSDEGIWVYDAADWSAEPRLFSSPYWYPLRDRNFHLNLRYRRDPRMALNADGSRLAMALCFQGADWYCANGTIDVLDTETGERIQRYRGQSAQVRGIAFLEDNRIVFGNEDTLTRIWSISSNSVPQVYEMNGEGRAIRASVDGVRFGTLSEYMFGPGFAIRNLETDQGRGFGANWDFSVVLSPDLRFVAWDTFYQNEGRLEINEVMDTDYNFFPYTGDVERLIYEVPPVELDGTAKIAQVYSFTGDNTRLVIGYRGGAIRLWDVFKQEEIYWLPDALAAPINSIAFSLDGAYFATVSDDYAVIIWDAKTGEWIAEL